MRAFQALLKPFFLLWESERGRLTGELLLYDDPNFGGRPLDVNNVSACPSRAPRAPPSR